MIPFASAIVAKKPGLAVPASISYPTFPTGSGSAFTMTGNASPQIAAGTGYLRMNTGAYDVGSVVVLTTPLDMTNVSSIACRFTFTATGVIGRGETLNFLVHKDTRGASAISGWAGGYGEINGGTPMTPVISAWYNFSAPSGATDRYRIYTTGLDSGEHFDSTWNMSDGNTKYAWVDYNHATTTWNMFINTTNSKPGSPVQTLNSNLKTVVGTTGVFFGFSSSTGANRSEIRVLSWQVDFT